MTIASAYGTLLQADDLHASGISMINFLLQLAVEGMSFCTWACFITLQFKWLHGDLPSLAYGMELTLHSLAPPVSSAILTNHLLKLVLDYWGTDLVATLTPLVFAIFMMMGMIVVGCSTSPKAKKQSTNDDPSFILSSLSAQMHTMILLLVPGTMHVMTFRDRIFSRYASFDEIYDLALVWTIPYLLQCVILGLFEKTPYSLPKILFPKAGNTTVRATLAPIAATLVASIAAQQRYLIPLCNAVSYQFNGHNLASTWVVSLYLTIATIAVLFSMIVWGRTSSVTNEPFFGEYHEDIVQLSVSLSGMLLGKAFGFPWNLTPLPILAFLGLSVWITTRMMRYLAIFLFVIHAAGVVVFGYRFASINLKIPLAMRGIEVTLTRFGMAEVCSSILIGLIVGFVARPGGGLGASFMKRVDVPGFILVAYCLLLAVLEVTLLRQRLPESIPSREVNSDVEDSDVVYDHATALITSCLIIGVAVLTKRIKVITKITFRASVAVALGKAIAVFIDASESDSKIRSGHSEQYLTQRLLYRVLVTSTLIFVILAPSALLAPIHMKGGTRSRRADDKIPAAAYRNISLYSLLMLPLALLASVPSVLSPLVMALSVHYNMGSYYNMALPVSETLGCALALWGVATLYMLNHYFPDGGCEIWKKSSALTLLMGVAIAFSAPTVPEWVVGENDLGISNSYARISSVGSRLATQGHNRTGGWGILSASLATLLAITGPFELRDRRHPSGRKDKSLFLRIMMFSIMFGCGISWFITILSMSQENSTALAITTLSCMILSFFGTIACVVAYHVELDSFDEVTEMAKVCVGVFILFLIVTFVASLLISRDFGNLFSQGGCVSTYLTITCCITLSFALALRSRSSKTQTSVSMSNLSCIICYVIAVITILGRFGVAGLDSELEVVVIMGMPASLFGIICIAPVLLVLEGEGAAETRSRAPRMTRPSRSMDTLGLSMKNLNGSNKFVPPLAATIISFYLVGLYTIIGRGAPFLKIFLATSHFHLAGAIGGTDSLSAILRAFRKSKDKKDVLALLAEKASESSRAYSISSHLEESGFWTATSMSGPLLHAVGLLATVPSAYLLLSQSWYGVQAPRAQMLLTLPLNLLPIIACAGTPTIRALGVILVLVGMVQISSSRNGNRSQMRF